MKSVGLTLSVTEAALDPLHAVVCRSPDLDREVILGGHSIEGVETITSFVDGAVDPYVSALDALETVREFDVTPTEDGFFLYLRRDLGPDGRSLQSALAQETVVVVPPIEIRADRTIRVTLVGHPIDLTTVLETAPDGVTVDVQWTSDSVTVAGPTLSDRQQAAVAVARERGYYEIPRRNGIEVVAADLDCAVSTASELLRRAEATAVDRLLESTR